MDLDNKKLSELIIYSEGGILSKVIKNDEKVNITLFSMAKGTNISEHTSTRTGLVYVIEGEGIFTLEDKNIEMLPSVLIHMKGNSRHAIKANSDVSFLLILVN